MLYLQAVRALLQRVNWANVVVSGSEVGGITTGLLIFLGVRRGDTEKNADILAQKITGLRIFEDEQGKMNWDLQQVKGSVLAVSQFTLYADTTQGRRPGFADAEDPARAKILYDYFCERLRTLRVHVETGQFGAHMTVSLQNDGPVTLLLESDGP